MQHCGVSATVLLIPFITIHLFQKGNLMLPIHFPIIRRYTLLLLTLLLTLSGTAHAATPPPLQQQPAQAEPLTDWQLITNEAAGFQIAIPSGWQAVKLSATTLGLGLSITETRDPQMDALLQNPFFQQMLIDGLQFMAFDLSEAGQGYLIPANVNIIKTALGGDLPLTFLQQINERQLAALAEPGYPLTSEILDHHGHEAIFFQYVVAQTGGLAQAELTAINQLLVVKGDVQYYVTVSIPFAVLDTYRDSVSTMLASFQLLDPEAPASLTPTATPAVAPIATLSALATPTPANSLLRIRRPTATPMPQAVAVVQIPKLNVRSGPGTGYGILGTVTQTMRLPVIGHAAGRCDWFQVQLPAGTIGWIAGPPSYSTLEGDCNALPVVPTPIPPTPRPATANPCVRFDNHFSKVVDVTLTMPGNVNEHRQFNIGAHGRQSQCLAPGRYTFSIGVPGIGNINGEFTLERGNGLLVIPIYQAFN